MNHMNQTSHLNHHNSQMDSQMDKQLDESSLGEGSDSSGESQESYDVNKGTEGTTEEFDFFSSLPSLWQILKPETIAMGDPGYGPVAVPMKIEGSKVQILATGVPTDELKAKLAQMGISESSKSQVRELVVNDRLYYMVPISPSHQNYSAERTSKKWGYDLGGSVQDLVSHCKALTFASSDNLIYANVLDGLIQRLYKSTGYKGNLTQKSVMFQGFHFPEDAQKESLTKAMDLAKAKIITRHLGDTPSNLLTPVKMAKVATKLGEIFGFKVSLLDQSQMKEHKMNSLLSVSQGSPNPPQTIICEIEGSHDKATAKPVVFIGKGVTFDSGGISLKPPSYMYEMKYDMLGGATVLGAMSFLATQPKNLPVVALVGCVENMPSHNATRPGDVVKSMSGKTIEILNTDAEGRLVMADLFAYAQKYYKPHFMIDVATLTGACLYALGSVGAALMSSREQLAQYLLKGAHEVGEPLWQLPLWQDLDKCMVSQVADVKNISSANVKAGTITAGIFLSQFVNKDVPWAHLDIAGAGYNSQAFGYPTKGASGYGVEVLSWAAQNAIDQQF